MNFNIKTRLSRIIAVFVTALMLTGIMPQMAFADMVESGQAEAAVQIETESEIKTESQINENEAEGEVEQNSQNVISEGEIQENTDGGIETDEEKTSSDEGTTATGVIKAEKKKTVPEPVASASEEDSVQTFSTPEDVSGTVYISVSYDGTYIDGSDNVPIVYCPVSMADIAAVDLNDYELGDYLYDEDGDGSYEITALQLVIYAHENIYGGDWSDVTFTGGPGSSYFEGGIFGFSENLNYYVNGEYPLAGEGWGATSDQIVLKAGDFVDIASFSSWNFYSDSNYGFHFFGDSNGAITHNYTVEAGTSLPVKLIRSYSGMGSGATVYDEPYYEVSYGSSLYDAAGTVTTDSSGCAEITFSEAGTYCLWGDGGYGMEYPDDIVSSPAYATVTVTEPELDSDVADVIEKINNIGEVTLESEQTVADVRAAYDALPEEKKSKVDNYKTLTDAESVLNGLNQVEADKVIKLIVNIGNVSLEKEEQIASARNAYENLSESQKKLVTNIAILTAAEESLKQLKEDAAAAEANQQAADKVIEKIKEIGQVSLEKEEKIRAAIEAYNALSDEQKKLVTNYDFLTNAKDEWEALKLEKEAADKTAADGVIELINKIGTVNVHSGAKINKARTAYDALTDTQKALVTNYNTLTDAETAALKLYKAAAAADHKKIYDETAGYISALGTPNVGSTGGEWMVIDITRAGGKCPEGYYENVVNYVKVNINENGQLHRSKSTENSRVILGLTAAGYDVTDVGGHNLLMGLTDMAYVKKQGINGPIWALIAFDSYDYEIPVNSKATQQVTREGIIEYILSKQLDNGGWALAGKGYDPDITGMAIQALAPYYNSNAQVKAAVDEAVAMLSEIQSDNGGFSASVDGACSESCAQVIVALTALGINPETDSRFIKNGMSVVDAMCLFAVEGGGFVHVPGGKLNGMATEQAQYALASYYRFLNGQTALYDMSDVTISKDEESDKQEDGKQEETLPEGNISDKTPEDDNSNKTSGTDNGDKKASDIKKDTDNSNKKQDTKEISRSKTKSINLKLSETEKVKESVSEIKAAVSAGLPENPEDYTNTQMQSIINAYMVYDALAAAEKAAVEKSPEFKAFADILAGIGEMNHYDRESGIDARGNSSEVLPWHVKISSASQQMNEEQQAASKAALGEESEIYSVMDIHCTSILDNSDWQPDGIIRISVPMVDAKGYANIVVVHINDNEEVELLNAEVKGDKITFETAGFSLYAIAATGKSVNEILGTENSADVWPWVAAAVAAVIALAAVIYRRKKIQ